MGFRLTCGSACGAISASRSIICARFSAVSACDSFLHLCDSGIGICRAFPVLIGSLLLALAVNARKIFAAWRFDPGLLRKIGEKLFVTGSVVPPDNGPHRCI